MYTTSPDARPRIFEAIINAGSGTVRKLGGPDAIARVLQSGQAEVRLKIANDGKDLKRMTAEAARGDADVVIAAGGDGTISGIGGALIGTGKQLAVIPLGTFNFFARRLGIPLELEEAAKNVFSGTSVAVTTGEVNGRPFLNKASIGLYPLAVRFRERMYGRYGRSRAVAILAGLFALLRRGHVMKLRVKTDAEARDLRTRFVFVCNNPEELKRLNLPGQDCLAQEKFAVYIPKPLSPLRMLALGIRLALRRVHRSPAYKVICTSSLELGTKRSKLPVSLDGEVRIMRPPLTFSVRARSLEVIVPPAQS